MKILAFSDLHRDTDAASAILHASENADVIVGAGDFAIRGIGAFETIELLSAISKPVIVVTGNHDNSSEIAALCRKRPNFHLLDGSQVSIDGQTFFGLGREVPHLKDADWNESYSEDSAANLLAACPSNTVLVTHSPPLGYVDFQADGRHEGSAAILDVIDRTEPILHLCGHIHFCAGKSATRGKTPIHNLGPSIHWFDV